MYEIYFGVLIASWIAYWGFRQDFLTGRAAVAAWVIGGLVWAGGKWGLAVPLVFFFIASSYATQWSARHEKHAPGRVKRDIWQVAANGAIPALCALIAILSGQDRWLYGGLSALAAMTGDTWSSEIGRVKARRPFDLRTRQIVDAGISGAVSFPGTLAGLAGVLLTTILGAIMLPSTGHSVGYVFLAITIWGFIAVWVDSILGATVQGRYRCRACNILTDHRIHCGQEAELIAGRSNIDNNLVNFLTTIFAALVILAI